jgi:hypothetical protein
MLTTPLLWFSVAHAAPDRLCFDYAPTYEDANGQVGDDYLRASPSTVDASGARVEVIGEAGMIWGGHLSADGCTPPLQLGPGRTFRAKLFSAAELQGNTVRLRERDDTPLTWEWTGTWPAPADLVVGDSPMARVMGAITFALQRHSAGATGKTIVVWLKRTPTEEPCAKTSCNHKSELYFLTVPGGTDHTTVKNVLLHELGHRMMYLGMGLEPENVPKRSDAPGRGRCPGGDGHQRNTVEWHSIALVEGFGHFYATLVSNAPGSGGCGSFSHYPVDWNLDGRRDGKMYRCDGELVTGMSLAPADYLGTTCGVNAPSGLANEVDYQRFFWDLVDQEKMTLQDILQIIARANQPGWNATWEAGSPNNPVDRLQRAADELGYGKAWARQAEANGVNR